MGGRRVEGGPAVSRAGISFRVASRQIRWRNLWGDVEPFLAKPLEARPRKSSRQLDGCPYQN
jgi:hypothetical protein